MNYEIQSRSNFKAGAELVVSIPEAEVDYKALNTILDDCPKFILPFRHQFVDGQLELTYQVGRYSKLSYLSGSRPPAEYAQLWLSLLQPLLDCDDWFMTPDCFVLQTDYLYCDKAAMDIRYVYIPSIKPISDETALKAMITGVAHQNRATDAGLENKVIWAIQDFNIQDFLQMIRTYQTGQVQEPAAPTPPNVQPILGAQSAARMTPTPAPDDKPSPVAPVEPNGQEKHGTKQERPGGNSSDICIRFPDEGKPPKESKPQGGIFGKKKKPEKSLLEKMGFKGKKNGEIMQGAAAEPMHFGALTPANLAGQPSAYMPGPGDQDGATQLDLSREVEGPHFRYVGTGNHPAVIEVAVQVGGVFTIGRFDVAAGTKKSSFEFSGPTKEVSRRHAAVERSAEGYSIVDLDSKAGTFLNGRKLPPNAPFLLERGCRVSFGSAGADYVWEE